MLYTSSWKARRPRLLIVDEDEDFRRNLRVTLEKQGLLCDEAKDGIVALQQLTHQPVHVVLTDYQMPKLNAFELKDMLTKHPPFEDLPVILLMAEENTTLQRQAEELGFAATFVKPLEIETFLDEVHRILVNEHSLNSFR